MIKCPNCGTEVTENTRFCPKCGEPINSSSLTYAKDSEIISSSKSLHSKEEGLSIRDTYEEKRVLNAEIDNTARPVMEKNNTDNTTKSTIWKKMLLIVLTIVVGIISYNLGRNYVPPDEEEAYAAASLHYGKHDFQNSFFTEHYETYVLDYRKEYVSKILEGSTDFYMVTFPLVSKEDEDVIFELVLVKHDKQIGNWSVTNCFVDRFGLDDFIY